MDPMCYHALVIVTHALSPFNATHCRRGRRPAVLPVRLHRQCQVHTPRVVRRCPAASPPELHIRAAAHAGPAFIAVACCTWNRPPPAFPALACLRSLQAWLEHGQKKHCELCTHEFKFIPVCDDDMPPELSVSDLFWGLPMCPRPHRERVSISHRRHLLGQVAACSRDRHV